jgi:indole-3-glycerol phosphate synthase
MSILQRIVEQKRIEIALAKQTAPVEILAESPFYNRDTISLKSRLMDTTSTGIIAEFKRHSPSKLWINQHADPVEVVSSYAAAGVAGASVLTDEQFFKGSLEDLRKVRQAVNIPLLRKDFMLDPYQMHEAKANGADVILLIAAILTPCEVSSLTDVAHQLGLEVLLELHGEGEIGHVNDEVDMVGINNRNLNTFEVDVEQTLRMADKLGVKFVKVAESGISSPKTISYFRSHGFRGFLIGETFMKEMNPGKACEKFIQAI